MKKNFPWLAKYPPNIPPKIESHKYESLVELFESSSKEFQNSIAFENMGVTLTYSKLDELATNFAKFLQSLGLKKGDRIAIQLPNILQFPVAFIGSLKAGLIVVNTNPLYTPREMEIQFKDAGISAIVILENFACHLERVLTTISCEHVIITKMGDLLGLLKGPLVNFMVKFVKKIVPKYNIAKAISFNEALKKGRKAIFVKTKVSLNDLAVLQYTGGTTGVPKGAQLSHSNLLAHNRMVQHWFKPYLKVGREDIVITAIPMYHIFGLTVNGILMHSSGVKNVLITNPRDMPGFVKELQKHKFTIMTGVNTLFNGLLQQPEFRKCDFSFLHGSIGGAMALQDSVVNEWKKVTDTPIIEGYGLSETSPVLCCNPLDGNHRQGSIGIPMPSTEVAIFDDDGNQVSQGQQGEICGKGPQVMKGYWNKDNDGVFFHNVWFRTGDIGIMDEDGFFKIVDRKKDMIKVSGFAVFPSEIENIISSHPKVLEVAAVGINDDSTGQGIKVFVVKKNQTITKDELISFCKENLTGYKVPKHYEFRSELPKSNVGKILRRHLREESQTNTA